MNEGIESDNPLVDKYTTFSPHARGYRKSVHKVPKWTKVSTRTSMIQCFQCFQ